MRGMHGTLIAGLHVGFAVSRCGRETQAYIFIQAAASRAGTNTPAVSVSHVLAAWYIDANTIRVNAQMRPPTIPVG